jgi:ATP-dependent helicase/DNAse subunit B
LQRQEFAAVAQLLTSVATEHFLQFARSHAVGFRLLWELEQERLLELLRQLLRWEYDSDRDFLPLAFEARFGFVGGQDIEPFFPLAPVSFPLNDHETIRLRGQIDRVDVSQDGTRARIFDYKSGKVLRGRFAGGTTLQLPLYLFAARVARPDLQWASAQYVYLNSESRTNTPEFTAENWSASLPVLQQIVSTLTQMLRTGCFIPTPDTCRPCAYPSVCGSQVAACFTRKHQDAHLAPLWQLREIP